MVPMRGTLPGVLSLGARASWLDQEVDRNAMQFLEHKRAVDGVDSLLKGLMTLVNLI